MPFPLLPAINTEHREGASVTAEATMTHRCSLPSVLCGPHEPSPSVCPSVPGPHPGCHVAPQLPISLGSSAVSVSQTVLGVMTLMVQGGWDRYWIGHP